MIFSREYSRAILNLREDDGRFSQGGKGIFGRAVVEVREGRGRIMVFAVGVKTGCICSLYVICRRGGGYVPLRAVLVNTKNARAEVKWDFNPDNISGSGFRLEDVGALAVLTDRGERVVSAFFDRPFDINEIKSMEAAPQRKTDKEAFKPEPAEDMPLKAEEPKKQEEPKADSGQSAGADGGTSEKAAAGVVDFTEVVNRFSKDIDELRRFAYMQKLDFEDRRESSGDYRKSLSVEGILAEREKQKVEGEGEFCRITIDELCLIDEHMYRFENNPTFRRCFNKYGHLLLGKRGGGCVLGLPDEERAFADERALGFCGFVLTKPGFGYRIMKIKNIKEKPVYENKKEELDRTRA